MISCVCHLSLIQLFVYRVPFFFCLLSFAKRKKNGNRIIIVSHSFLEHVNYSLRMSNHMNWLFQHVSTTNTSCRNSVTITCTCHVSDTSVNWNGVFRFLNHHQCCMIFLKRWHRGIKSQEDSCVCTKAKYLINVSSSNISYFPSTSPRRGHHLRRNEQHQQKHSETTPCNLHRRHHHNQEQWTEDLYHPLVLRGLTVLILSQHVRLGRRTHSCQVIQT